MKTTSFIPVFTPSQLPPEELEKLFVQRHELLRDAEARVKESATTGNKHHLLFVGPRGSGKTHFVSLLVHRLDSDPDLRSLLDVAWLNEDETCTGFLDLLIKIYEALAKRDPVRFGEERIDPVYEMKPTEGERFLGRVLLEQIGKRAPLIVVENLDLLFQSIGDEGQKKLRAYLQEHPVFAIVATAQALVEDLTDRSGPFFGYFQTEHLKVLSLKDATDLLGKIAARNDDQELIRFLATPKGRSRVRALHFLSGGNHRVFIVLSQFINRENIEQLVEPFRKMVDELTPYYQERVRSLPPLQRKIVEYLCKSSGTVPVKEIAKRMLATHQTVSKQLQELRGKRYVSSFSQGRESLYEVSEPLMRICVEVKENQSYGPLRLLVDFIRVWHETDELARRKSLAAKGTLEAIYYDAAYERMAAEGNLRQRILIDDLKEKMASALDERESDQLASLLRSWPEEMTLAFDCLVEGRKEEGRKLLEEVRIEGDSGTYLLRALLYSALGDAEKAIVDYTKVLDLEGAPVERVAIALFNRGLTWGQQGDFGKAIADYTALVDLEEAPVDQVAKALLNRGWIWGQQGDPGKEIADYTAVVVLKGVPVEQMAMALFNRANTWNQLGDLGKAIADYTTVVDLEEAPVDPVAKALLNRGVAWVQQGDCGKAIEDYTTVLNLEGAPVDQVAMAFINRGNAWGRKGDPGKAIADYTAVVDLEGAPVDQVAKALICRGTEFSRRQEFELAEDDFRRLLEIEEVSSRQLADCRLGFAELRGRQGRWKESLKELWAALQVGRQSSPSYICDLEELIGILYGSGLGVEAFGNLASDLIQTARDNEVLVQLGEALVRHLGVLAKSDATTDPSWLKRWAEVWQAAAEGIPEMAIPLRMFGCGVEFLCSPDRDESILHRLKSEERMLLRETLQLEAKGK